MLVAGGALLADELIVERDDGYDKVVRHVICKPPSKPVLKGLTDFLARFARKCGRQRQK